MGCSTDAQNDAANESIDSKTEYDIQDVVIKTRDGASISGMMARKKGDNTRKPVILQFTIYVRDTGRDLETLKQAVDEGYIGVIAYTRGKRYSPEEIWPYEHDGNDCYDVIDWISKKEWSDGRIGMYGGSYNGFTQWAATKKLHPALKTIVPYVANRPGMGLPTENGVFVSPNYSWSLFIGSNKYFDTIAGNDNQRFRDMQNKWWESGVSFSKIDSIDGTSNRMFQRWIEHPSYDDYWQNMTPYEEDFAQIDIPILSVDGYYNDSQNSSLYYVRQHYKYRHEAEHYLIIGPYSHFGAQRNGSAEINGYPVDKDALINTNKITYEWFDYIFKNAAKPAVLQGKINYQVMGANEWRSAPSIEEMSNESLKLYLTNVKKDSIYSLSPEKPQQSDFLYQEVDFADRETSNNDYYPDPIVRNYIDMGNGFNFLSEPLAESIIINGSFLGELNVSINKLDFDFGVTLYEVLPDGSLFNLSYIIQRASYAHDATNRTLLTPGKVEVIPFSNSHLISKKIAQGNSLLIHVNVNKNPFSDLNYGTGKEVAQESIKDANEPLKVKWYNNSFVEVPIWKD